jgi:polar amino acid transport system substrate-binding protein
MKKARVTVALVLAFTFLFVVSAVAGPVLDSILERGELRVGTSANQPPLTAKTKDGKIIGLDADLSRAMAAAMGVKPRIEAMPFSQLLTALEEGRIDMILSGMTMTPQRNLKVVFVGPYYISGKGILTKIQTLAAMQEARDMNKPDFTLAALKGSTSQIFVENLIPNAKLLVTDTLDEAMELIFQNKADALIADYPYCAVMAFRHQDKGLTAGQARLTFEPLGIALPANDPHLVNWVENFLALVRGSGELERLAKHWFSAGPWVQELP